MENKSGKKRHPTDPIKPRRPFGLSLIFWVLLLWSLLGWLRFARSLMDRTLVLELLPAWIFWYLVLAGLSWGLAGLPLIWGILRRSPWILKALWFIGLFYPLVYWIERLFLWSSTESKVNWPFMLFLTVFWLGLIIWASRSKRIKRFLRKEKNEEK